ncbi:hypothetical protein D3C81_1868800 [compost metagenome]
MFVWNFESTLEVVPGIPQLRLCSLTSIQVLRNQHCVHILIKTCILNLLPVADQVRVNVDLIALAVGLGGDLIHSQLHIIVEDQVDIDLVLRYSFDLQLPVPLIRL